VANGKWQLHGRRNADLKCDRIPHFSGRSTPDQGLSYAPAAAFTYFSASNSDHSCEVMVFFQLYPSTCHLFCRCFVVLVKGLLSQIFFPAQERVLLTGSLSIPFRCHSTFCMHLQCPHEIEDACCTILVLSWPFQTWPGVWFFLYQGYWPF